MKPGGDLTRLAALATGKDEGVRATALRLAGLWKLEALRPQFAELVGAMATPDALREAAIEGLASLGGNDSRDALDKLAASDRPSRAANWPSSP